jgi:hypothetical protein
VLYMEKVFVLVSRRLVWKNLFPESGVCFLLLTIHELWNCKEQKCVCGVFC